MYRYSCWTSHRLYVFGVIDPIVNDEEGFSLHSKRSGMEVIGVGRFRILGRPRGVGNSKQAHDVVTTSCAH